MIEYYFPTPVYKTVANQMMFSTIQREIEKNCSDLTFSKREEWVANNHKLSDPTFSSNLIIEKDLKVLQNFIKKCVKEYLLETIGYELPYNIMQSWMTKTVNGEITTLHNHGMFDIAGVYYYKTNGQDGAIKFLNPNTGLTASQTFIKDYMRGIIPKEGQLILFPAWLNHTVEMNTTDNERMSLAFNINIDRSELYDNSKTKAG